MCINFNGSHSGGSTFVNINDCWLLQKLLYTTDISSALKKKKKIIIIRSPSIWFRTPKPVQIHQSGRTGIEGVTRIVSSHSHVASSTPRSCHNTFISLMVLP